MIYRFIAIFFAALSLTQVGLSEDPNSEKNSLEEGKKCENGDLDACFKYSHVAKERLLLSKKGCDSGKLDACFNFASIYSFMYPDGVGFSQSIYVKICDLGHAKGCVTAGSYQLYRQNMGNAKKFYKKACNEIETSGCVDLAFVENRLGNKKESKILYQKICDLKKEHAAFACTSLGQIEHENGNKDKARKLFKDACEMGGSCNPLAQAERGFGNLSLAKEIFKSVCDKEDYWAACIDYAELEEQSGNLEIAKQHYRKNCPPHARACFSLGNLELRDANFGEASRSFEEACKDKYAGACEAFQKLKNRK